MRERLWDFFVESLMWMFMPLVCSYHALSSNPFLNVSVEEGTRLEQIGNVLLSPVQYILAGQTAIEEADGDWKFIQRFDYNSHFWIKITSSVLALPPSLFLGSAIKGASLLDSKTRSCYLSIADSKKSKKIKSNLSLYEKAGIQLGGNHSPLIPLGCQRRPGDELVLEAEKEALKQVGEILTRHGIPWWVDCGTCLGAYRYGGVIPWDGDIDIGVLLPDFQNVLRALNHLDPAQYSVQDWSSREHPQSFIKVFIRKTGKLIDIYHFAISAETQEISYLFSLENNIFFPEWLKIRERRFKTPVSFSTVFPLRKGVFDGVEVFVPNDTEKYLQRYYGENLNPVKVYHPETNSYEKDLSHPYWSRAYVH